MTAPTVLLGRTSDRLTRKSRLLFHWRADRFDINALSGQVGTLVRGSDGGLLPGADRILRQFGQHQPRFMLGDLDSGSEPALVLQAARTQICPNPQSPAAWASIGTPTVTGGVTDPWGGSAAVFIEDDDAAQAEGKVQAVVFTGDGTKCAVVAVRAGSSATIRADIHDITTATSRHRVLITWNSGTTAPTVSTSVGTGTIYPSVPVYDAYGNLWWLVQFSADGVVAANVNQVRVYAGTFNTDIGTFYFAGANAWDATYPSSWQPSAAHVRAAEGVTFPVEFAPAPMTFYADFIELAQPTWVAAGGVTPRVLQISNSGGADTRLLVLKTVGGTSYSLQYDQDASPVSSNLDLSPSYGDRIRLLGKLYEDGSVRLWGRKNDGAEVAASISGSEGSLSDTWSSPTLLHIAAQNTIGSGDIAVRVLKFAQGDFTMAQMQEIA